MNPLLTHFAADDSSGIGALGVDSKALVIQLVTFLLAFLVLQKFAFKPIIKMMDARRQTIEDGVALGEKMKQDQAKLEASKIIADAQVAIGISTVGVRCEGPGGREDVVALPLCVFVGDLLWSFGAPIRRSRIPHGWAARSATPTPAARKPTPTTPTTTKPAPLTATAIPLTTRTTSWAIS